MLQTKLASTANYFLIMRCVIYLVPSQLWQCVKTGERSVKPARANAEVAFRGWPEKFVTLFVHPITSSNVDRFSNCFSLSESRENF